MTDYVVFRVDEENGDLTPFCKIRARSQRDAVLKCATASNFTAGEFTAIPESRAHAFRITQREPTKV